MSGCGDASLITGTAAELFQLAALLVGDTAEAVLLVEETVSAVEIDPCLDPKSARRATTAQLVASAVARLRRLDPGSFASVPTAGAADAVCVEDEDLSAAGISQSQLTEWLAHDGRQDLRDWLAALPGAQRAIFVQRAVLGSGNAATAQTLVDGAGAETSASAEKPSRWSAEAVGEVYRLALCSLANSLAHARGVLQPVVAVRA